MQSSKSDDSISAAEESHTVSISVNRNSGDKPTNYRFTIAKRYESLEALSYGAYGIVVSATDTTSNKDVAIKKITNVFANIGDAKRVIREIRLLIHFRGLGHVIPCYDVMLNMDSDTRKESLYIITPLMDADLESVVRSDQLLSESHLQYFSYQIFRALKYIHSAGVIHRDLKPANILVNKDCTICLCDFGLARTPAAQTGEMTSYVVTRWYRAPELLLGANKYTSEIDVWSVGCIIGEMLRRTPLLPGNSHIHQLELVCNLVGVPKESELSEFVQVNGALRTLRKLGRRPPPRSLDLVFPTSSKNCVDFLAKIPSKRASVEGCLSHAWLSGYRDETTEPTCDTPFVFELDDEPETGNAERAANNLREEVRHIVAEKAVWQTQAPMSKIPKRQAPSRPKNDSDDKSDVSPPPVYSEKEKEASNTAAAASRPVAQAASEEKSRPTASRAVSVGGQIVSSVDPRIDDLISRITALERELANVHQAVDGLPRVIKSIVKEAIQECRQENV